jgi:hypothetical protein
MTDEQTLARNPDARKMKPLHPGFRISFKGQMVQAPATPQKRPTVLELLSSNPAEREAILLCARILHRLHPELFHPPELLEREVASREGGFLRLA